MINVALANPNAIAYLMLLGYPLVVLILLLRLRRDLAVILSLLIGALFLPELTSINPPALPSYSKRLAPTLAIIVFCIFLDRNSDFSVNPGWLPQGAFSRMLILLFIFSPTLTSFTNPDPLFYGPRFIPGMGFYEIGAIINQRLSIILTFLVARRYLYSDESHALILKCMIALMLFYSLFILLEVRISPQLHYWIYGFYPFNFMQMIRESGFRPSVFFLHGLWLSTFVAFSVMAALAIWRSAREPMWRMIGAGASVWLTIVLFLCKSLGPVMLAVVFAPIVRILGERLQSLLVVLFASVALLYPTLRSADLVPIDSIHAIASQVSERRAQSFMGRMRNEALLLEHVAEKRLLGWGLWGRHRVYDEISGKDVTLTDGAWIIEFAKFGWVGYLTMFGMLTYPLFLAARNRIRVGLGEPTMALCLIMCMSLMDLMLNAFLVPFQWMLVGAILGRIERGAPQAVIEPSRPASSSSSRPCPTPVIGAMTR